MSSACVKCGFHVDGIKCSVCGTYVPAKNTNNSASPDQDVSMFKKATSFTSSVVNYARSGFKNVLESVKRSRLEICEKCEFHDKVNNKCNQCGCYLSAKASWASESCPIGKWGQQESPKNIPKTCGGCNKKSQK
jgi:hypothetical protein